MPRRWLIALVLVFTGVPLGDVAVSGRKDRKFYRVFVFRCVRQVSRLMTWRLSREVSGVNEGVLG